MLVPQVADCNENIEMQLRFDFNTVVIFLPFNCDVFTSFSQVMPILNNQ